MKSLYIWVLVCILIGCKPSLVEPDPTPPPVAKPEINVFSADKISLVYGETTTVTWQVVNATTCSLAGVNVGISGSTPTVKLVKDTTISIIATGNGSSASSSLTIKVSDWTTSDLGLISHDDWKMKTQKYLQGGLVIAEVTLNEQQKAKKTSFTFDGKVNIDGAFSCSWSFTSGRILVGDQDCTYSLSKTQFIRSFGTTYSGQPAIMEITYGK
jgi:hypothetical protein